LVNDQYDETSETQEFTLSMTVANGGFLTGVIDLNDGEERQWKLVAAIGPMAELGSVDIDTAIDTAEVEWNFAVTDICAQAGILTSRVGPGETYLFEQQVWVGDEAAFFRFENYEDSVYESDSQEGDCGEITYTLVDENYAEFDFAAITLDTADPT
jgi:hypothetical protein